MGLYVIKARKRNSKGKFGDVYIPAESTKEAYQKIKTKFEIKKDSSMVRIR